MCIDDLSSGSDQEDKKYPKSFKRRNGKVAVVSGVGYAS